MEAATATHTASSGTITPGSGPQPTPAAPKPQESTSYLVFEAPGEKLGKGDTLTFVARVSAHDKKLARWAAVDKTPELAERVESEDGKGGVWLLAVAERNAQPEMTVEEVVKTAVRR